MSSAQLTPNFNLIEFACKDGTPVPPPLMGNVIELAEQLQVIRDYIGEPVYINSAYRTPAHNKKVGGAKDSQHLKAKAADITAKSVPPLEMARIVEKLIREGMIKIGGVGVYPGFVHVDTRNKKARW